MNVELEALARRAVACPRWRWMPGMAFFWRDGLPDRVADREPGTLRTDGSLLPDLTDPATLGCLVALVREAYADQCACVFSIDYGPAGVMWQIRLTANGRQVTARNYTTEAEALVAALEAAQ